MVREAPSRRAWTALAAAALAMALSVSPAAIRTAAAAGPLRVQSDATYTLDPPAGRVHVAVTFRLTNLKSNTATTIFYYSGFSLGVQPEARGIRATDRVGALSVTTRSHRFFTEVEIRLRNFLYYRDSTTFTIRYDLVGGAPRSESPTRVGRAFAAFGVWAWGDPGLGSVEVRIPTGYQSKVDGGPLDVAGGATGQILSAEPAKPEEFFAIVSAEDPAEYGHTQLSLGGGIEIDIWAWPEDKAWSRSVADTLSAAMPALTKLIGLPWPVAHDLVVRERYTPALEGYAGFFLTDEQRIDITEDLDPVTIVHEASHAWLNDSLFTDRWIYEGLAEQYAWQTLTDIGSDAREDATKPDLKDPGYVDLDAWAFPQVIRDQQTDDRERYGYEASFWVVHAIAETAGIDQMRAAFAAADGDLTAYPGTPSPESVAAADGWQRFLDLAQPIAGPDSAAIEQLFVTYVLDDRDDASIERRHQARAQYRELLTDGEGWLPPWNVRKAMGEWNFVVAGTAMDEAAAVLDLRDQVGAAAAALNLQPDDALRTAYESTTADFATATQLGRSELGALAAIESAKQQLATPPDLIASLGLLGEPAPAASYDQARVAFEAGDLDGAVAAASAATAILAGAAAVGQQRLIAAVAALAVVTLLLILLAVARRRRSRRPAHAAAASAAPAAFEPVAPAGLASIEPVTRAAPEPLVPTIASADPDREPPEPAWWLPTRDAPDPAPDDPSATLAADPATDLEGDERP